MTEKKRVDEILWQIGMLVGAGRTDKLETLITEHLDEVAAAERARIKRVLQSEIAKWDALKGEALGLSAAINALQVIDAGEPMTEGGSVNPDEVEP